MRAANSLVTKDKPQTFSAVISGEGAQKLIKASLRDDGAVARFTGTMISVVNASEQLRNCEPGSIISAALRGEGAGLIYGQGYYVVPYGSKAGYITSAKGWTQLAIATGLYADIDVLDVREGERKGRDKRTGKPIIDMSVYDTDEERETHEIIGVKAYFLLKDGYYREEYWSMGEILRHADRYSQAFSLELYNKWKSGAELTKDERYKVENGSPWYTATMRMAKKTVLKSLLTSGFAPLSNEVKTMLDAEPISGEAVLPDLGDDAIPEMPVDETTGEVVDTPTEVQEAAEAPYTDGTAQTDTDAAEAEKKPVRRGRPPKAAKVEINTPDVETTITGADIESEFFGEA